MNINEKVEKVFEILFSSNDKEEFRNKMIENGYDEYIISQILNSVYVSIHLQESLNKQKENQIQYEKDVLVFKDKFMKFIKEKIENDFNEYSINDVVIIKYAEHIFSSYKNSFAYKPDSIYLFVTKGEFKMDLFKPKGKLNSKSYDIKHLINE